MSRRKNLKFEIQEELERRILHGLSCEWETALWVLKPADKVLLRKPLISIRNLKSKLGYWSGEKKELCLSRDLVLNHPWDSVREVFLHEMAHQFAEQVMGAYNDPPHGSKFQRACYLLRANPRASGTSKPLWERISDESLDEKDKLIQRVKKLLALAQSQNRHEAEAAMLKAHELIAKYNLNLYASHQNRNYISVFVGNPALRHPREEYHLAHLLQDFYFVQGLWVSAYVLAKGKLGRVLEISGTPQNIKIASYVYAFVKHFINSQWQTFNQDKGLNRYRKTDFAVGIIEGFCSKLETKRLIKEGKNEKFAVLKIEDPLLNKYVAYKYPYTTTFRGQVSSQDENILKAGKRIGRKLIISKGIAGKVRSGKLLTE
ncbi:MAG: DUF2786 domain-containing protein [bacterium]|nr:MAG: DUF2786 domain-containing protein [bacterium]